VILKSKLLHFVIVDEYHVQIRQTSSDEIVFRENPLKNDLINITFVFHQLNDPTCNRLAMPHYMLKQLLLRRLSNFHIEKAVIVVCDNYALNAQAHELMYINH